MRRRASADGAVRERYTADVRRLSDVLVDAFPDNPFTALLRRLEAGEAVVVYHGYELDMGLPPDSGPYLLGADGSVSEMAA